MSTTTTSLQPIPYVSFDGKCREAMHFYEAVFGAKIKVMVSGADAPLDDAMMSGFEDKILNAQLELPGGGLLYGGDTPPHIPYRGIVGVGLALNFDSVEEMESVYEKLLEGGEVNMPIGPTFWAKSFAMVTDKYGVGWMLNGVLLPM